MDEKNILQRLQQYVGDRDEQKLNVAEFIDTLPVGVSKIVETLREHFRNQTADILRHFLAAIVRADERKAKEEETPQKEVRKVTDELGMGMSSILEGLDLAERRRKRREAWRQERKRKSNVESEPLPDPGANETIPNPDLRKPDEKEESDEEDEKGDEA